MLGTNYEITPESEQSKKYPDIVIVKKKYGIVSSIELKKLYVRDQSNNKIVKTELNYENYESELRDYLKGAPFVILTNLEKWFLFSHKDYMKTNEIKPIKEYIFEDFVENVQNIGFQEFIFKESIEGKG